MVLSMDRWTGKVAVVTGASSGIGASIAEKLVEAGLQEQLCKSSLRQAAGPRLIQSGNQLQTGFGIIGPHQCSLGFHGCMHAGSYCPSSFAEMNTAIDHRILLGDRLESTPEGHFEYEMVAGLARRIDRLEEIAKKLSGKSGKFHPIKTDLSSEAELLNAFKWIKDNLGPIHILINNAGIMNMGLLSEGVTEKWQQILQVNVIGLSIATREAIKDMKENKVDGHIIHINSVAGHYVLDFPVNMYYASKHGVTALTQCLRKELASLKSKIKITSISPGGTDTELVPRDMKHSEMFEKLKENKGILDPEDVTDGVIYVLSTPPHVQVHELMIRPIGEMY